MTTNVLRISALAASLLLGSHAYAQSTPSPFVEVNPSDNEFQTCGRSYAETPGSIAIGDCARTVPSFGGDPPNVGQIAIGHNAISYSSGTIAIGQNAGRGVSTNFGKEHAIQIGTNSGAGTAGAVAVGWNAISQFGVAIGRGASGDTAIGSGATSTNDESGSTAVGRETVAEPFAVALGGWAYAAGNGTSVGVGSSSAAQGVALGRLANSSANSTAIGYNARATGVECLAFGFNSECTQFRTVAFGSTNGGAFRLTNVDRGFSDTDAANVSQLRDIAGSLGAGARFTDFGQYIAPSFFFPSSGQSFSTVNDSLLYLDGRIDGITGGGGQGPAGPAGANGLSAYQVAQAEGFTGTRTEWLASLRGQDGQDGRDGVDAPGDGSGSTPGPRGEKGDTGERGISGENGLSAYEIAYQQDPSIGTEEQWIESLQGQDGRDGRDGSGKAVTAGRNIEVSDSDQHASVSLSDNIELSQNGSVTAGQTTLSGDGVRIQGGPSMTANGIDAGGRQITSVAPGRIAQGSMDAVNGGQIWDLEDRWDRKLANQDRRIDRMGAQSAALSMMNGAGVHMPVGKVAINAGVGFYRSEVAIAVGARARLSERSSLNIGLSLSNGGEVMGGVGYSLIID